MRAYRERVGTITWIVLDRAPGFLAQDLAEIIADEPQELLVDFTHATTISADDGVALCRHLWSARAKGANIVLGAVRKRGVRRFVDNAGLSRFFPCEERLPEAIAHFRAVKTNFLGEMLVQRGLLDDEQLDIALRLQEREPQPRRLGAILTDCGFVDKGTLIRALFKQKMRKLAA